MFLVSFVGLLDQPSIECLFTPARFVPGYEQDCVAFWLEVETGNPGSPRWLCTVRNRRAASPSPDSSAGMLAKPRSCRCGENSSQVEEESSSGTRTSQVCANGIADPEAVPAYVLKANADSRLRAVNQPHRTRPAVFKAIRGLTEPIDLSGLRLGI
jgi:hypothetical protein